MMRAKMRVMAVTAAYEGAEIVKAFPVCGQFDANGDSEDNTYARYTPSGSLELVINNPSLRGKIKEGQVFYIDFTLAGQGEQK